MHCVSVLEYCGSLDTLLNQIPVTSNSQLVIPTATPTPYPCPSSDSASSGRVTSSRAGIAKRATAIVAGAIPGVMDKPGPFVQVIAAVFGSLAVCSFWRKLLMGGMDMESLSCSDLLISAREACSLVLSTWSIATSIQAFDCICVSGGVRPSFSAAGLHS